MALLGTVTKARGVMADFLGELADSPAFWYLINGDHTEGFSLFQRFEMIPCDFEGILVAANLAYMDIVGTFKIKPLEWEKWMGSGDFVFCHPGLSVRFDKKTIQS